MLPRVVLCCLVVYCDVLVLCCVLCCCLVLPFLFSHTPSTFSPLLLSFLPASSSRQKGIQRRRLLAFVVLSYLVLFVPLLLRLILSSYLLILLRAVIPPISSVYPKINDHHLSVFKLSLCICLSVSISRTQKKDRRLKSVCCLVPDFSRRSFHLSPPLHRLPPRTSFQ